eukprot:6836867-Pyramimonas_sp.AAC.1
MPDQSGASAAPVGQSRTSPAENIPAADQSRGGVTAHLVSGTLPKASGSAGEGSPLRTSTTSTTFMTA